MTTQIKELIDHINAAKEAYYNDGEAIMSDREYDALEEQLKELQKKEGIPDQDIEIPVGAVVSGMRKKVTHEKAALSLDKTKSVTELVEWLGQNVGVLSWKMDGLTIVATYNNGHLVQAVTRGNGIVGEDVTDNARKFVGLPAEIPYKEKLTVRAEAVMTYEEFNRIVEMMGEDASRYKNPRNLATGTVRRINGEDERTIELFVFQCVNMKGKPKHVMQQFRQLEEWGFQVVGHRLVTPLNLAQVVEEMKQKIASNPFPSDGLVLTYNDSQYAESLGNTGKFPRGSMAFKWQDEAIETSLTGIEWQASRSGLINPVAVFEPVEIDGTSVSRASLFNVSYAESLQLGTGDKITVYKANMIIPQIAENLTKSGTMTIPKICPACGEETEIHTSTKSGREVKTLYCSNKDCPAKHLGRFQRFVCRDAMNIVGLSDETLKKFIDKGWLRSLSDIYRLQDHKAEMEQMEGFGKKSVGNILKSIEASKHVEPWRFLYAMSIPNVGRDVSKKIIRFCGGSFDAFLEKLKYGEDVFRGAEDVGEVIQASIYDWKQNRHFTEDMANLVDMMDFIQSDNTSDVLAGKTVVITGTLETFKNRDEFIAFVEQNGGKVSGSVSKKTSYLVNNDVFSNSSKNKKAKELGVPIVNEKEFKALVLGGEKA